MEIRQVGEGAYFVSSYSEQTIIPFQPTITNQMVTIKESDEDISLVPIEDEDDFTKGDFERALKKASHRLKQ